MATYYYAAYLNTPLHQSPAALASHHPLGISSNASNLPMTPASTHIPNSSLAPKHPVLPAAGRVPVDEQQDSILFRLPAELRNQIYGELLCPSAQSVAGLERREQRPCQIEAPRTHPAILSSCRKAHEEATDLLYTKNIFHAHPSLLASLPHLTSSASPVLYPNVLAKIKRWHFTVRLDTDPRFTMSQATAAFSGAEYLEIRVWQSTFDGCDYSVMQLFLGVHGVKIAKVRGSTDTELACWLEASMMQSGVEAVDACQCEVERVATCERCVKKLELGSKWFGARNAWQFGNR
jgi:hypothetical protein